VLAIRFDVVSYPAMCRLRTEPQLRCLRSGLEHPHERVDIAHGSFVELVRDPEHLADDLHRNRDGVVVEQVGLVLVRDARDQVVDELSDHRTPRGHADSGGTAC
jgi:hypothetical protein